MAKLDFERKERSRGGADSSKSKFKVSINGASRKRKAASAGDDRPRSSSPRPRRDSGGESPRRMPERRSEGNGMKRSGERSFMTENKWSNSRSSRSGRDFGGDSFRRRSEDRNQSSEGSSGAEFFKRKSEKKWPKSRSSEVDSRSGRDGDSFRGRAEDRNQSSEGNGGGDFFKRNSEKKWPNSRSSEVDSRSGRDFSRDSFRRRNEDRNQLSEGNGGGDFKLRSEKNSKTGIGSGKDSDGKKSKGRTGKLWSGTKSRDEQNPSTEKKKKLKTKVDGKKRSDEEAVMAALGERPKRKVKMGIRLDPYDISNKRLDDSIAINETQDKEEEKKKKEEESEKGDLSMNAQFRAIKPSSSILTYVQDNMLGRRRDIDLRRAGYNTDLSAPLDNIPFSTGTERERIEESIFRNKLDFFAAAKVSSSFPPPDAPEIAFAGRSNVGKSSLLNALTRQWGVVRTSDKPGLTQTINFFNLGPKLNLVDLPGYGFAYAKEEVKDSWEELVKEYVATRVGLKRVCLLIDTKWGMKPRDHELINLMERSETKYQVVLTKTDVVFPMDVARRAMQIEETLKANKSIVQPVMMVSSKSGAGIRSLRTVLAKLARFVKP